MSHYSRNDRMIWQEMRAIKKWAERNVKLSNKKKAQSLRGSRNQKTAHIECQKTDNRLCRQASRPWQTSEQQADFGHIWKEGTRKVQTSPTCTQPIQDAVRLWVRDKRAWFGDGERGKPILRFLLGLFWGKCPAGMTHHPNKQS